MRWNIRTLIVLTALIAVFFSACQWLKYANAGTDYWEVEVSVNDDREPIYIVGGFVTNGYHVSYILETEASNAHSVSRPVLKFPNHVVAENGFYKKIQRNYWSVIVCRDGGPHEMVTLGIEDGQCMLSATGKLVVCSGSNHSLLKRVFSSSGEASELLDMLKGGIVESCVQSKEE